MQQSEGLLLFEAHVPSELETVFCCSPEWEVGFEHVTVFESRPKSTTEAVEKFLWELATLAESSLAGALQCCYGVLEDDTGKQ